MATPMRDLLPRWYPYADDRVPTADEITSEYLGYEFLTRQLMAKIGSNEFSFSPHSRRSHRSDCTLTIKSKEIKVELKASSTQNIPASFSVFGKIRYATSYATAYQLVPEDMREACGLRIRWRPGSEGQVLEAFNLSSFFMVSIVGHPL